MARVSKELRNAIEAYAALRPFQRGILLKLIARAEPVEEPPRGVAPSPTDQITAEHEARFAAMRSEQDGPRGAKPAVDRRRGQCFIHLTEAIVDRLDAMRKPGESYSDVMGL